MTKNKDKIDIFCSALSLLETTIFVYFMSWLYLSFYRRIVMASRRLSIELRCGDEDDKENNQLNEL